MSSPPAKSTAGAASAANGRPTRHGLTVRFAGDSGDGMLLTGHQFTAASLRAGNDAHAYLFFPSEIRAPEGSPAGVSAFQVHLADHPVHTAGDRLDVLVAMNPASLRQHLPDLEPGGMLIVNEDAFTATEVAKAGYAENPLANGKLAAFQVVTVPIDRLNRDAVAPVKLLSPREADRCRNFFTLGLACWLFDRPLEPIVRWIREKFLKNPVIVDANTRTLKAGYQFGEKANLVGVRVPTEQRVLAPGRYRRINGNEALGLGLVAAAQQAKLPLVFAGFPMLPAGDLQQQFFALQHLGVRCVNAEDEAAAIGMALGAAFAGGIGVTATSGPGLCAKAEALGLAVVAELPLVVLDVQRVGPGNGIPSQSEQGDLLQALFGRTGESPLIVLAPTSPADGFACAVEAVRLAIRAMSPVIVLTDTHLAHGSEPWRIPEPHQLPSLEVPAVPPGAGAAPFARDTNLVRPWIRPGTPNEEYRLGGLEKEDGTGHVSADPVNHERMVALRADKIARLAGEVPALEIDGPDSGELLVLGWGSTWGAIRSAAAACRAEGKSASAGVLRCLHPLPRDLGATLKRYRRVLVAELNAGQLLLLVRAKTLIDAVGFHKVQGQPFEVAELKARIESVLGE